VEEVAEVDFFDVVLVGVQLVEILDLEPLVPESLDVSRKILEGGRVGADGVAQVFLGYGSVDSLEEHADGLHAHGTLQVLAFNKFVKVATQLDGVLDPHVL